MDDQEESSASDPVNDAVKRALKAVGPTSISDIGTWLVAGFSRESILEEFPFPGPAEAVAGLLANLGAAGGTPHDTGQYLLGVVDGYALASVAERVEVVWSGPASARVPVRATSQVVQDVIGLARKELLLMTYSAKPHPPLIEALNAAIARGVKVAVVVETLQGAGSALQGSEPAAAFSGINGVAVWEWPPGLRAAQGGKMHAKIAVADRSVLFATSANLTAAGAEKNIEAGLLVTGGDAPRRAVEHVEALQSSGVLKRLYS